MARALSAIVRHLLDTCGPQLGCSPLVEGHPLSPLIEHIHRAMGGSLSRRHIRTVLDGRHDSDLRHPTADAWARFFRQAVPAIEASWLFLPSVDDFQEKLKTAAADPGLSSANSVAIRYPRYRELMEGLQEEYSGATYVCYRYPFEGLNQSTVAREVLHIGTVGTLLEFSMSFWPAHDDRRRQFARTYNGVVFPAGRSLFLVGFNINQTEHDRGRSLFFDDARGDRQLRNCKLGILSTTRLYDDLAPCAACTILVRVQWQPDDLAEFFEEATTIDDFEKVIHADFGIRDDDQSQPRLNFLRAFLDNRVAGSIMEPELARIDGARTESEPVLRVNPGRFNREMPLILKSALDDDTVYAPFKPNWPQRPRS